PAGAVAAASWSGGLFHAWVEAERHAAMRAFDLDPSPRLQLPDTLPNLFAKLQLLFTIGTIYDHSSLDSSILISLPQRHRKL
ncbi:MAG TPA: hypothetical protein DDY32_20535, partial [Desulfobulbaceae bacterium]|nr:hypothetical protein [Desulfobulbaceae bacterium]